MTCDLGTPGGGGTIPRFRWRSRSLSVCVCCALGSLFMIMRHKKTEATPVQKQCPGVGRSASIHRHKRCGSSTARMELRRAENKKYTMSLALTGLEFAKREKKKKRCQQCENVKKYLATIIPVRGTSIHDSSKRYEKDTKNHRHSEQNKKTQTQQVKGATVNQQTKT